MLKGVVGDDVSCGTKAAGGYRKLMSGMVVRDPQGYGWEWGSVRRGGGGVGRWRMITPGILSVRKMVKW